MATFTPRTSAPGGGNLCYKTRGSGGYNRCILGNSRGRIYSGCVLPNCTGYAWGRFIECQGFTDCSLSTHNAGTWYGHTSDGYTRNHSVPYLGAVICWSYDNGGAGHVAVVEKIYSNTDILWSESNWSGTTGNGRYWRTIRGNPANFATNTLNFQGYIYPPTQWDGEDPYGPDPDPSDPDDFEVPERALEVWSIRKKKKHKGGKLIL